MATKFWYPRTCSENLGCILELTNSTTLGGISKTCAGHAGDFGRSIGIPAFTGLVHNAPLDGEQAVFDTILAQNQAGTEEQLPNFIVYDEMRIGDLTAYGMPDILLVYQAAMVRPGDNAVTSPPNATFLDGVFSNLKAANPSVNRVCLDYESWNLITDINSPTGVNTTVVGWYVTLVNAAKPYFSDVGLYGEIPERHSIYLNFPVGHATYTTRRNNWFSRSSMMQPMWDVVNTIYPSMYYINPIHNDMAKFTLWTADTKLLCDTHAPGKTVYPFLLPRIHPSIDPEQTWVSASYWRSTIDLMFDNFPGYAIWLDSSETPDDVMAKAWWTEQLDFNSDHGLI
jgi:hypothetical protein